MKKYLIIIFAIGFIALGSVCFYLKTQIDTARNDILNLTATVSLQEENIAETESELNITESRLKETESELNITESGLTETESELTVTYNELNKTLELNEELEKELVDTEQELDYVEEHLQTQKAKTSELQIELEAIQAEVEAIREELQLYHDTGIRVAQGIVPPYTASLSGQFNLENDPDASNISWSQLKDFLREDRTDNNPYVENVYMCGEFAEDLHNNAENSGIRAAFVAIQFEDGSNPHALNAFVTTDRGLVYIDTTGTELGIERPRHMDCIVTTNVGKRLYHKLLFATDWKISSSRSIVSQVEIYW